MRKAAQPRFLARLGPFRLWLGVRVSVVIGLGFRIALGYRVGVRVIGLGFRIGLRLGHRVKGWVWSTPVPRSHHEVLPAITIYFAL